ncbi:ExbD/TolR family protein [Methyloglobulus sp.]|uniref:ExbD/TolR family protein n=1 Tax=Methyloglobulus sp. TaxID=2518622 RepID=UPI0032B7AF1A
MAEINVVPYIDVTLVLLIIFMITTPMLQTGVEVDLPVGESSVIEQKEGVPHIVISIEANGQHYINVDDENKELVQPDEIKDRITALLSKNKNAQVKINADKSVGYGSVFTVILAVKNAGVPDMGFLCKLEDNQ